MIEFVLYSFELSVTPLLENNVLNYFHIAQSFALLHHILCGLDVKASPPMSYRIYVSVVLTEHVC